MRTCYYSVQTEIMACPLFLPASPLSDFEDGWTGCCAAQPGVAIPVDTLRRRCNPGYARDACAYAACAEPDAFRFLIQSESDGVSTVAWSSERDHHPLAVGTLLVAPEGEATNPLERQARACASADLWRTRA